MYLPTPNECFTRVTWRSAAVALAVASALVTGADVTGASASQEVGIYETMQGIRVGPPGHSFEEKGRVLGTLAGSMTAHVETIDGRSGIATITLSLAKGTISARARTHGHVVGATGYFEGGITIIGGSGSYAHTSGTGLEFKGTLNRQSFRMTAELHGSIRL